MRIYLEYESPTQTLVAIEEVLDYSDNHFLWKRTRTNYELEIWLTYKVIFLKPARSTISFPWEATRTMTLLRRHSIQLNKSLTVLKTTFYENAPEYFLSSKSDVLSNLFSDQPDQQLVLHENLLGLLHSHMVPLFNWTSPWLNWKSLFMKTHQNYLWARNLTTY